jgi:hypothetical protein
VGAHACASTELAEQLSVEELTSASALFVDKIVGAMAMGAYGDSLGAPHEKVRWRAPKSAICKIFQER